jgi:hypothetical protein
VSGAGIAQLALFQSALHSADQTCMKHTLITQNHADTGIGSTVTVVILNQIIMNLSIITANIPGLHRFCFELQVAHGTLITIPRHDLHSRRSSELNESRNTEVSRTKTFDKLSENVWLLEAGQALDSALHLAGSRLLGYSMQEAETTPLDRRLTVRFKVGPYEPSKLKQAIEHIFFY